MNPKDEVEHNIESIPDIDKKPLGTKVMIGVSGFILVLIMITYSISAAVDIPGLLRSHSTENGVIQDKITIVFEGDNLEKVQQEYLQNQEREIKACLYGEKEGNNYFIHNVTFPEIYDASVVHVTSAGCPGSLIDLHSHPWYQCTASQQDLMNMERTGRPQIIMCAKNLFSVYS